MDGRIAVVGAGLTGLLVAHRLADAGRSVTVFDKSRGLGGRLATRRSDFGAFDHGAPVIHCERAPLQMLIDAGACAPWDEHGHVGIPAMSRFVRPLAEGLDIRLGCEIIKIERDTPLTLVAADGARHGPFETVVSAIPAPQARRFTADEPAADAALSAVRIAPVWTLMAAFDERPDLPDVSRPRTALDLVVRNAAKPQRDGAETWVCHAAHDWTGARLELAKEAVLPLLLAEFEDVAMGRLPTPVHVAAHRWRYALTVRPLGAPFLAARDGAVLIGGDWALGSRAEHAWLSGQAMADAILG